MRLAQSADDSRQQQQAIERSELNKMTRQLLDLENRTEMNQAELESVVREMVDKQHTASQRTVERWRVEIQELESDLVHLQGLTQDLRAKLAQQYDIVAESSLEATLSRSAADSEA